MKHQNNRKEICRLFLLLFAICLLSLVSCPLPFNSGIDSSPVDNLPPGMGSFSLAVSGASRTLMPETPVLGDFKCLELIFRVGNSIAKNEEINNYNGVSPLPTVILEQGTYSLTVNAYKGPGKTNLAARGEFSEITIIAGQNTSASVILKALLTEGEGTFIWNITFPAFVNEGYINIKPLEGDAPSNDIDVSTTSASGSSELNSGVYNVTFDLSSDTQHLSLKWNELVYIYSSLDTVFNKVFDEGYFYNTHHDVTFVFNNGTGTNGTQSVIHGDTVQINNPVKTSSTAYLHLGAPPAEQPGFVFAGWYSDSAYTIPWILGTSVVSNTTLYAKWAGAIDVSEQGGANDVEKAIAYVNANAAAGAAYTLFVCDNVSIAPQTFSTSQNLTIQGLGAGEKIIQYSGTANSSLFTIDNPSASLTLGENVTLQGATNGTTSLVSVTSGTLVMEEGSKITGHTYSGASSTGGGVYVAGGTFNMKGGEISGNTANDGAGVYIAGGIFKMTGGIISGNKSINENGNGCGVYLGSGSGIFTVGGTAKILDNLKENGIASNVNLCGSDDDIMSIILGTGGDEPVTETGGMEIHVSINAWSPRNGIIVQSGADAITGIENCFYADDTSRKVVLDGEQLVSAFKVASVADLQKVGTGTDDWTLSAYYIQTANITLDSANPNNWTLIGGISTLFTGTYNGGGHTITGLSISAATQNQGMFAYIGTGGKVENLGLIGVNINTGTNYVGGIAGRIDGGTIQNCYVSGSVTGNNYVGGIAGISSGTIQNCYVSGSVTGFMLMIGGIAGQNQGGGTIRNCVALNGKVTLTGSGSNIGRIIGSSNNSTQQDNYAWDGMTLTDSDGTVTPSPSATGKDGASITAAEAKTAATWTTASKWSGGAWDFSNNGVWRWIEGNMPSLKNSDAPQWPLPILIDVELVSVPAGETFMMGSPNTEVGRSADETQHLVTLTQGFSMSKYQVTQGQYQAVMGSLPSSLTFGNYGKGDNYPVYYVSWYDAIVFCNKLSLLEGLTPAYTIGNSTDTSNWGTVPTDNTDATWDAVEIVGGSNGYRLPTEAQWEYAARGGALNNGYKVYSGSDTAEDVACYGEGSPSTQPVGTKAPNELGIYDMSGNVWEWCWDWYDTYPSDMLDDYTGPDQPPDQNNANRVVRGGGYRQPEKDVRSARRGGDLGPYQKYDDVGFRVVLPMQ